MPFKIFTDSCANLNNTLLMQNEITVIPMPYFINGTEHFCTDIDNFDDTKYYTDLKNGANITTSQINPQKYIEYMEPELKAGNDILFIGVSSGISGSFTSAQIAKDELLQKYPDRRICLTDSLAASLGEGLLVLKAAEYKKSGMNILQIERKLAMQRKSIYQIFIVDDLSNLHRSGRVSALVTAVGSVLGIRPLLKGNPEGKIVMVGKTRGKVPAIKSIADKYFALVKNTDTVGISYAGCKSDAGILADLIKRNLTPKNIIMEKHEPATGSHLGFGALALYFEGNDDVREN